MYRRSSCPACGAGIGNRSPAVISPWIRELAKVQRWISSLVVCGGCGTGWFDQAFDSSELARIYEDYREPRYTRIRNRWEPWYTSSWNDALSDDESTVSSRNAALGEFLLRHLPDISQGTVVDVGGDRGQYIPTGLRRIVIDPSNRELVPGVERISTLASLREADLLISAHVLEHLPDPRAEVLS